MGWYITILQEMREDLGLKGNELLVFAVINGFSQGGQGCYYGSLAELQRMCGIASRQTAVDVLKSLVEKGLISKSEIRHNGIKYVTYSVCPKIGQVVQKMDMGSPIIGHNIEEDININRERDNKGRPKFQKPSVEEIRTYCLERRNNINPEEFFNFYESKGWVVGKSPMKDWRAAVRTWEISKKDGRSSRSAPKQESVLAHNLKVADQLFGTNYYAQAYGRKEGCDEQ